MGDPALVIVRRGIVHVSGEALTKEGGDLHGAVLRVQEDDGGLALYNHLHSRADMYSLPLTSAQKNIVNPRGSVCRHSCIPRCAQMQCGRQSVPLQPVNGSAVARVVSINRDTTWHA